MRLAKKHVGGLGSPNITPLCDIMLSLLIFFMLVSRVGIETGADEDMTLPEVLRGVEIEDFGNTITLNVYPVDRDGGTEVSTLLPLTSELKYLVAGGPEDAVTPLLRSLVAQNPNLKLIIRGDESLEYRYMEPVLLAASRAQVASVNTAVSRADNAPGGGS